MVMLVALKNKKGGRRDVKMEIKSGVTGGSIPWDELPGSVVSLLVIVSQECPRSLVRSIQAAPATAYSTPFLKCTISLLLNSAESPAMLRGRTVGPGIQLAKASWRNTSTKDGGIDVNGRHLVGPPRRTESHPISRVDLPKDKSYEFLAVGI
jgi:hypothetical protein